MRAKFQVNLKALVPVALVPIALGSVFALSGCSPEGSAARNYCRMYLECEEDAFEDEYDHFEQCVKINRKYAKAATYEIKVRESPECATANQRLERCAARSLTCDAFDENYWDWYEDFEDECDREIEEYEDWCDRSVSPPRFGRLNPVGRK